MSNDAAPSNSAANQLADTAKPPSPGSATGGEYTVVARRYRPQGFTELVGQGQVSQALTNAIGTNRVGHAYLFTGARGVGKTSTARIFAKALNCQQGPTATPCNQCDICQSVSAGEDVDVLEIDGASNRGIDEIRQLRANVNVRPSRARYKVYIIDEVHMLTTAAFNALLKTLEEPPEHVKFIFCTTDPEKIPITVLSRCQRYDFAAVKPDEIVTRLQAIVKAEGLEAEPAALEMLARRAAGSMRDSQSLLEQLLAYCDTRITLQDVHTLLGTADQGRIHDLVAALAQRDAPAALAALDEAVSQGVDVGQLVEQLIGHYRDLAVAAVGGGSELLLYNPVETLDSLAQQGQTLGVATILAVTQILDQTLSRMRQSIHTRVLAEMAVVRICQLENLQQLSDLVAQLRSGQSLPAPQAPQAPQAAATSPATSPVTAPGGERREGGPSGHAAASPSPAASASPSPAPSPSPAAAAAPARAASARKKPAQKKNGPESAAKQPAGAPDAPRKPLHLSPDSAMRAWTQAIAKLEDMTADFAAAATSIAISGPNRLAVLFPKGYNLNKEFCERPERRASIQEALSDVLGHSVTLEFGWDATQDSKQEKPAPAARKPMRVRMREIEQHPMVCEAVELFGAEIVQLEAGRDQRRQS